MNKQNNLELIQQRLIDTSYDEYSYNIIDLDKKWKYKVIRYFSKKYEGHWFKRILLNNDVMYDYYFVSSTGFVHSDYEKPSLKERISTLFKFKCFRKLFNSRK